MSNFFWWGMVRCAGNSSVRQRNLGCKDEFTFSGIAATFPRAGQHRYIGCTFRFGEPVECHAGIHGRWSTGGGHCCRGE